MSPASPSSSKHRVNDTAGGATASRDYGWARDLAPPRSGTSQERRRVHRRKTGVCYTQGCDERPEDRILTSHSRTQGADYSKLLRASERCQGECAAASSPCDLHVPTAVPPQGTA